MPIDPELLFQKINKASEEELVEFATKSTKFKADDIERILVFLESKSKPLETELKLYDCCGTGGDRAKTFNISTCAAIIAAANSIKIAKNGGRASSSKTGSVDVLEALGINLNQSYEKKFAGIKKYNLGFFSNKISAEMMAPLKEITRKHRLSSFISLIGPFASPIKLKSQVIGVGKEEWLNTMVDLSKEYVTKAKREKIFLVQSKIFLKEQILDELSTASESLIIEINQKKTQEYLFNPKNLNIEISSLEDLMNGSNHKESATIIEDVIQDQAKEAKINSACLNASLISCLREESFSYKDLAREYQNCINLIKTGKVKENFDKFRKFSNNNL